MLAYIIEKIKLKLWLLFDIQPLVMYKGGRPQNFMWEHFLQITVGNMQSVKSVVISKLIMLPEYKSTTQIVQRIQFHQHVM